MRRTKVIATVGPASIDAAVVGALVDAGADVLRINCSHITTEELSARIKHIRQVRPLVAIMVDIQGPKLRYAGAPITLVEGSEVSFTFAQLGMPHMRPGVNSGLAVGQRVLLHD